MRLRFETEMAFSSSSSENNFGDRSFRGSRESLPSSSLGRSRGQSLGREQPPNPGGLQFDILNWYPRYQSCQKYFLDHAQHDVLVQAFAAFVNILLPFQRSPNPIYDTRGSQSAAERIEHINSMKTGPSNDMASLPVSLLPYVRRLVATGFDVPQILHGFFGDDWIQGIGPQREQERRNYMFAAKSGGWASVKRDYDMLPLETVPFLRPLNQPSDGEIEAAEKSWSEWLALEDWMVGSRAPEHH